MRTIQLIVNELRNENLIFKQNGKFYSSKNLSINSPYITEQYRQIILEKILHPSTFHSKKQLIHDLVNRFGLILVFNFIIAHQDIKENNLEKVTNFYDDKNNEISWLKNVISIDDMYNHFIKVIKSYEQYYKAESVTNLSNLMNSIKFEYPIIYSSLMDIKNQFTKQE